MLAEDHLVVSGVAEEGEQVWANEPTLDGLFGHAAASTYARRGCIPVHEALGPDADDEDLQALQRAHPLSVLDDLPAFAVDFGDHLATVRMAKNRDDLFARLDVGRDWPMPTFGAAFQGAVGDPRTGRIGYAVPHPPRAAALALLEELPFGICNEADPDPGADRPLTPTARPGSGVPCPEFLPPRTGVPATSWGNWRHLAGGGAGRPG